MSLLSTGRIVVDDPRPSALREWRTLCAFLLAPMAASCALSVPFVLFLQPNADGLESFAFGAIAVLIFGASPLTLFVALPGYIIFLGRLRPTLMNCVVAGAAVPVVGAFFLALLVVAGKILSGTFVLDARAAMLCVVGVAPQLLATAASGTIGGLVFWAVAFSSLGEEF